MNDQEKIAKLKAIKADFQKKVLALKKIRDEKVSAVKKGITSRRIIALSNKLKN